MLWLYEPRPRRPHLFPLVVRFALIGLAIVALLALAIAATWVLDAVIHP